MDSYQRNTYDPTGYFSISDCSIAISIQSTLSSVNNFLRLHGIIRWANAICTVYDTAMEIRNVILDGGNVGDVIVALLKGVVVISPLPQALKQKEQKR